MQADLNNYYRIKPPEQTYLAIKPILSEMGITRVANITGLDNVGIHVATCIRPNSKHLSVSQGKGLDLISAKVSAMMESIEGYHAENPAVAKLTGTYHQLKKHYAVLDPNAFRRRVFLTKDLQDYEFEWITVKQLLTNKPCYLPRAVAHIDSTRSGLDNTYFNVSSNGLASGNNLQEAILHACYELIERDSLMHWQQLDDTQRAQTEVDVTTVNDDVIKNLLNKLKNANVKIKCWLITSNFALPAFQCAIMSDQTGQPNRIFTGSGAHINKAIALSRAITEAAQGRLTVISGNRDDVFPDFYRDVSAHEILEDSNPSLCFADIFQPKHHFLLEEHLNYCLSLLQQQGINEIYYLDHTKPKFNIPVVQVFSPDLLFNGKRV